MRSVAMVTVSLLAFLSAICSVHAYVYFVEAENFDPGNSVPVVGEAVWTVVEDSNAFNNNYVQYSGPHAGAVTGLLYPIPNVSDAGGTWKVWLKCLMPDGGANSYFFYVSTDGGNNWGPQQTAGGAEGADWKWEGWTLDTPLGQGDGNVLKVSEREDERADVICIRNDDITPTDEEYGTWQAEHEAVVEPLHKIATTWGSARSAY